MNEAPIKEPQSLRIEDHAGLIGAAVRRWLPLLGHQDVDDVAQEIRLAYLRAIQYYNPEAGYRVGTYIVPALHQAVALWRSKQAIVNMDERTRRNRGIPWPTPISLDTSSVKESQRTKLRSISSGQRDIAADVERLLAKIPKSDAVLIRRYYGIGQEPETLPQIGRSLGLGKERARQLIMLALRQLQDAAGLPPGPPPRWVKKQR